MILETSILILETSILILETSILILIEPVVLILILEIVLYLIGEVVLWVETRSVGSSSQLLLQYEDREGQVYSITRRIPVFI